MIGGQQALERFLQDIWNDAAESDNARWLRQNAAAIERAHREMIEERENDEQKSF